MNTTLEILKALNVEKNPDTTAHAKLLLGAYTFFKKELSLIHTVETEPAVLVMFGQKSELERQKGEPDRRIVINQGIEMNGERITVKTKRGIYSIVVPVGNKVHDAFCDLLGIDRMPTDARKILKAYMLPASVIASIAKARLFVGKDDFRPILGCVRLEINNGKGLVVATDCHRLYISQEFDVNGSAEDFDCCIPASQLKKLPKIKDGFAKLEVFENNQMSLHGLDVENFTDGKFPDWRVVVPEYETSVQIDRVKLLEKVKEVLPYSNKSSAAVEMFFNGKVFLHTADKDFALESNQQLPYISKTAPDFYIAKNGKFLLDALNTFDSTEIQMWTAGQSFKGTIMTDGGDRVLLMPLFTDEPYDFHADATLSDQPENDDRIKKEVRIYGEYLRWLFENCHKVIVHRYDDKINLRYLRGTGQSMVRGQHQIAISQISKKLIETVEGICTEFGKPIIQKS